MMAALAILAVQVDREADPVNILFSAVFFMLVINPYVLFDVGFQLSVGAVLALVIASAPVGKVARLVMPIVRLPAELFLLSAAVQLFLAPVIAYYFFSFSLLAPLCNVFAVPPAGILLYGGLLEGLAGMLWQPLSLPIALFNRLFLSFLLGVIAFTGSIPFCALPASRPGPFWLLCYYGLLGICTQCLYLELKSQKKFLLQAGLAFLGLLCVSGMVALFIQHPLRVVFLDAGEGDALYLSLPSREHVLIDGGPRSQSESGNFDIGERVVLPFLRGARVSELDLVCLSHCHDDHSGGLITLVEQGMVGRFIEGPSWSRDQNYLMLQKALKKRHVLCRRVGSGTRMIFSRGVTMEILAPFSGAHPDEESADPNRESLVMRVSYRGKHILFMGDCDREGEYELLRSGADLSADIIKIGHHGSAGSSSSALLDAVKPRIAVVSVGRKNRHGHPSPQVLHSLRKRGIRVYRTDVDGAVICTIDSRSLKVRTMRE